MYTSVNQGLLSPSADENEVHVPGRLPNCLKRSSVKTGVVSLPSVIEELHFRDLL